MNPVLVALDLPTAAEAERMANLVLDHVAGFKIGLELLMGEGPEVIDRINDFGLPVFVDAKLHDIPNTVASAVAKLGKRGARWVTVHASGGQEMIRVAAETLHDTTNGSGGVLAVTVLTSLDESALRELGVSGTIGEQARRFARLASDGGAEGVICSVHEVRVVKTAAPGLIAVTPGIRSPSGAHDDQRRVATPIAALAAGADYLVIGRAITGADDPTTAAAAISQDISDSH